MKTSLVYVTDGESEAPRRGPVQPTAFADRQQGRVLGQQRTRYLGQFPGGGRTAEPGRQAGCGSGGPKRTPRPRSITAEHLVQDVDGQWGKQVSQQTDAIKCWEKSDGRLRRAHGEPRCQWSGAGACHSRAEHDEMLLEVNEQVGHDGQGC